MFSFENLYPNKKWAFLDGVLTTVLVFMFINARKKERAAKI